MLTIVKDGKEFPVLNAHDMRVLDISSAVKASLLAAHKETQRAHDAATLAAAAKAGDTATVKKIARRLK